MEDCSIGQIAVAWVRRPNFESFCCEQPFVCQVSLSSGPSEISVLVTAQKSELKILRIMASYCRCFTARSWPNKTFLLGANTQKRLKSGDPEPWRQRLTNQSRVRSLKVIQEEFHEDGPFLAWLPLFQAHSRGSSKGSFQ